jgi:phosphoenolpyruvate carboxykinase (GTP)
MDNVDILKEKAGNNFEKLSRLNNPPLLEFIAEWVNHCNPNSVFVATDSEEDIQYIKSQALKLGEETPLITKGHTVHFDGFYDQARDKENTKFLITEEIKLGVNFNTVERKQGLEEMHGLLKDSMKDKEMYVLFFCLGPVNSHFSILAVQITDSSYVAHSENILYRRGYRQFEKCGKSANFFKFVHSAGELEKGVSKNVDKRRIYIDLEKNTVFSVNTQYGGNTIGLKKLCMRLAIKKASEEGWLTEHMFIMGVNGPSERITYFTGAFPSACGKTATAMIKGETIVGDDIAYIRERQEEAKAVNPECGMFGIIRDVNSKSDPLVWETLHSPREIIFSNVLITKDRFAYWSRAGGDTPKEGTNYSGQWYQGKRDSHGKEIPPSHGNARFTIALKGLKNCDSRIDDPEGVKISGIIYGGRDSDTAVPVQQSFDWEHGIITMGATLESETTAATLGKIGVRKFNPMSNLDFLSIPLDRYLKDNLEFGKKLKNPPIIFTVNYFLKGKDGEYLTGFKAKYVWLKWMELRVHQDVDAIKTPTGYIPRYEDLKKLFEGVLNEDYSMEDYVEQFTLRINENLAKISRILEIYKTKVPDTPDILFKLLHEQKTRLELAREKYGDYAAPAKLNQK